MDASSRDASQGSREQKKDVDFGQSTQDASDVQDLGESLSAIDRQYAVQNSVPRRIYILGTGSIGKLVAHALRGVANPPPVTLILHKRSLLKAWREGKQAITIEDDGFEVKRKGFDVELTPLIRHQHGVPLGKAERDLYQDWGSVRPHEAAQVLAQQHRLDQDGRSEAAQETEGRPRDPASGTKDALSAEEQVADPDHSNEPIHNLIITTKASQTLRAILPLKHRLSADSTLCFLQNGMGIIDELNKELFPDETTRPNYMQGILTHGVNVPPAIAVRDPFYAVHAGHGTIALGLLPRAGITSSPAAAIRATPSSEMAARSGKWAASSRYLLRSLTRIPVLCAVGFTPTELLQQQLEKLAVNSVLNPLTVLLDTRNGGILYNFAITRTLRLLLAETSLVIRSLPELKNIPNVKTRFSPQRLETLVVRVANTTKDNISSMLADVRAGRQTEVEYINGYIVRRGEEIGIKCVVNYAIMQTVIGKAQMTQREARQEFADGNRRDLHNEAS